MAVPTDTRLGPGTLKLGTVDYGAQISNVSLVPAQDSNDGTPTLGNPDPLPELAESWTLEGSAIQDFELEAGFVNYCMDHSLEVVAFEWIPNTDAGTKFTGNVQITALPIGGDVAAQNTSDFKWAVQGTPTRVAGAGIAEGTTSREIAAARASRRSSLVAGADAPTRRRSSRTSTRSSSSRSSATAGEE